MTKKAYVELYKKYDLYRSDIYLLTKEKPAEILFLFDEVCDKLIEENGVNNQIPNEFIIAATRFTNMDTFTNIYFSLIDNRAFFLSDLIDFLALIKEKR